METSSSSVLGEKAKDIVIVGFEILPWACRFTEWAVALRFSARWRTSWRPWRPPTEAKRALSALQGLLGVFPKIEESLTSLCISLRNPGAVVHPGVMYGWCCEDTWDGKPVAKKSLFYQGVDEYTEKVLVGLSDEFQELKKAIAAKVQVVLHDACTLYQWYMDCYSCQISHEHLRCVHGKISAKASRAGARTWPQLMGHAEVRFLIPARHRVNCWTKRCDWKRFNSAALNKRYPIIWVGGRVSLHNLRWRTERRGVRCTNWQCFGGWEGCGLACRFRACCHFGQEWSCAQFWKTSLPPSVV